jgi:hypothetical protein
MIGLIYKMGNIEFAKDICSADFQFEVEELNLRFYESGWV